MNHLGLDLVLLVDGSLIELDLVRLMLAQAVDLDDITELVLLLLLLTNKCLLLNMLLLLLLLMLVL